MDSHIGMVAVKSKLLRDPFCQNDLPVLGDKEHIEGKILLLELCRFFRPHNKKRGGQRIAEPSLRRDHCY